jgi:AhpC/TSA family
LIKAQIGRAAPPFLVSHWVQGTPVNLDKLIGRVVLLEVFQVNCPGCFLYALPQAIDLNNRYSGSGLTVLGIATAFEDFDKNTLENLQKLVQNGEVIGETFLSLSQHGLLKSGRLPYRIPFPLAMDKLVKRNADVSQEDVSAFIREYLGDFDRRPDGYREKVMADIKAYLQKRDYLAQTFDLFNLQGTPSCLLIDKKGILRASGLGSQPNLENSVLALLGE